MSLLLESRRSIYSVDDFYLFVFRQRAEMYAITYSHYDALFSAWPPEQYIETSWREMLICGRILHAQERIVNDTDWLEIRYVPVTPYDPEPWKIFQQVILRLPFDMIGRQSLRQPRSRDTALEIIME